MSTKGNQMRTGYAYFDDKNNDSEEIDCSTISEVTDTEDSDDN